MFEWPGAASTAFVHTPTLKQTRSWECLSDFWMFVRSQGRIFNGMQLCGTVILEQDASHSSACGLQGRSHCSRARAEPHWSIGPLAHCRKPLPASSRWPCFTVASDSMIFGCRGLPVLSSLEHIGITRESDLSKPDFGSLGYSQWPTPCMGSQECESSTANQPEPTCEL